MALPSPLTVYTFNHADQIDALYTVKSSTQIKAAFDSRAIDVNTKVTAILTALASTTDSDSGADAVKATAISGLTGTSIQALLESAKTLIDTKSDTTNVYTKAEINSTTPSTSGTEILGARAITGVTGATAYAQIGDLKTQIDGVVLGSIPDNSLTNAKLGTDLKVGSLALLSTSDKTSVVNAINEIYPLNTTFLNYRRKTRMGVDG
jgi:hypothetical protein